jgi:hypothetical protein
MVAFSYGAASPRGHIDTVKSKPPILVEQLNARIRPFRIDGRWNPTRTHHPERLARLATLVNARGE